MLSKCYSLVQKDSLQALILNLLYHQVKALGNILHENINATTFLLTSTFIHNYLLPKITNMKQCIGNVSQHLS